MDDELLESSPSYTFNLTQNTYLVAKFSQVLTPRTITASVNVAEYGTAVLTNNTRTGASDFNDGESVTLTATPNSGYTLTSITDGETEVWSGNSSDPVDYDFTVSTDHAFVATFAAPVTYTVTLGNVRPNAAQSECSATVNGGAGAVTVTGGSTVTLHAEPGTGTYNTFLGWATNNFGDPLSNLIAPDATTVDYVYTVTDDITIYPWFGSGNHSVAVTNDGHGTASVSTTSVTNGGSATFTAEAASCYTFSGWYNGDVLESTDNPYTKTSITANVSLEARFAQLTYAISSIGSYDGGSVTADVASPVACGTDVTLTATAADGYTFTRWSDDVTTNTRTFASVSADIAVTPVFTINQYTVTLAQAEGGTATVNGVAGPVVVNHGSSVALAATANSAAPDFFSFNGWSTNNGDVIPAEATVNYTPTGNVTVTPAYVQNIPTYTVAVNQAEGGSATVSAASVQHGATATFTATPDVCHTFVSWSDGNTSATYVKTITENTTLTPVYAIKTYSVTVNSAEHGTATASAASVDCDGTVTFTVTPDMGYSFSGWEEGGNSLEYNNVRANISLTPVFTANVYTFSVGTQGNGDVNGSAEITQEVAFGTPVSLTATPATHYHFAGWTGDMTSSDNPLEFTMGNAAVSLTAHFEPDAVVVNVTVDGEGTVNGYASHTFNVTAGNTLELTATPASTDYTFSGWSGDATGNANPLIVTPTANMTIAAAFAYEPVSYAIAATAYPTTAGSVSGAGSYVHDTEVTLTATAEEHYTFSGWYEGGVLVSSANPYFFSATAARTLEARFEAIEYTITVSADPAEYGRVETSGSTTYGAIFRMNAIANDGYRFVQWNDGNTTASRSINVIGNAGYIAHFEEVPETPVEEPAADVLTYLDNTRRVVTGIREDLRAHLTTVHVPSTVERIANRAFVGANALVNVTMPASVDTIGDSAFYMLRSLVSINLPTSLDYLGSYAFAGCTSLQSVSMPAVLDTLRQRTFAECSALRRIEIPATVKEIGAYALYDCDNIYQLTIPASVDTVRENAFYNMNGLRFVTIEGGNHHFGSEVFRYGYWYGEGSLQLTNFRGTMAEWLTNTFADEYANPMGQSANLAVNGEILTDIAIPAGTDRINEYAFYNDDQVVTITIPASVDTIGAYAFAEMSGLERIVLLGIPKVNEHAFEAVSNDVVVMVPCEKLDSIRTAGWSHFDKFYANGVPVLTFLNNYGGRATVLQEPSCTDFTARFEAVPGENYTFKAWSDGDTTNPRTMILDQDETIGAIWERIDNPVPLESKTISFDQTNADADWYLADGTANKWYVGRGSDVAPRTGTSYLYISNDGGATNSYSDHSDAYTYREFYLGSGTYRIRFHWQGDGNMPYNGTYGDYLKAYLLADGIAVDFDQNINDGDDIVIGDTLAVSDTWIFQNAFVNVPATGWYKMVFYWRNQYGNTGNPGAAVDNIYMQFQDEDVLDDEYVTLRVVSDDESKGTVTGGGIYTYNETVTVTATPNDGYQFSHWNDGNTDAERSVRAGDYSGSNQQLVAYFGDRQFNVALHVSPAAAASAEARDDNGDESYSYYTNENVSVRVVEPQAGYAFMGWSTDGTADNIVSTADPYTFAVTGDVTLTAVMASIDTVWIVITRDQDGNVTARDTTYTNPDISSPTPAGSSIGAYEGGRFNVVEMLNVKIYASMGQLVVEDANGQMVTVFDVNGRRLASKQDTTGKVVFDVPATGTYMVKIGELITKKVVVMK